MHHNKVDIALWDQGLSESIWQSRFGIHMLISDTPGRVLWKTHRSCCCGMVTTLNATLLESMLLS